ncbi:MAG: hypothetical protein ACYTGC_07395 [Planctomycetota bacterium]|jgi:hypothetical protein
MSSRNTTRATILGAGLLLMLPVPASGQAGDALGTGNALDSNLRVGSGS